MGGVEDLTRDAARHGVELFQPGRRNRRAGGAGGDQLVGGAHDGLETPGDLDVGAEDVGDGVAVLGLGQPPHGDDPLADGRDLRGRRGGRRVR